jgi:hypothetical protein
MKLTTVLLDYLVRIYCAGNSPLILYYYVSQYTCCSLFYTHTYICRVSVDIPIAFCGDHLQVINCVGIVPKH